MKLETLLDKLVEAEADTEHQAIRARILKMFEEKDEKLEMIEAGYDGLQYEMNKQLAEKEHEIERLKKRWEYLGAEICVDCFQAYEEFSDE